jgi:hypothetical protein
VLSLNEVAHASCEEEAVPGGQRGTLMNRGRSHTSGGAEGLWGSFNEVRRSSVRVWAERFNR